MDATSMDTVEISDRELEEWKTGAKGGSFHAEKHSPTLPWIHTEDLVAGHHNDFVKQRGWVSAARFGVALTGLTAFALKIFKMTAKSSKAAGLYSESKLDRYLI